MGGGQSRGDGDPPSLLAQLLAALQGSRSDGSVSSGQQDQQDEGGGAGDAAQADGARSGAPQGGGAATAEQLPPQLLTVLRQAARGPSLPPTPPTGQAGRQGAGGVPQAAGQSDALPALLRLALQHMDRQGSAAQGSGAADSGAGGQPQGSGGPGHGQVPVRQILQLALAEAGGGSQGAGLQSSAGGSSSDSLSDSLEMQLSQELAANLKKLKAIIAETQDLAQRIETVLGQQGDQGGGDSGGSARRGRGGGPSRQG